MKVIDLVGSRMANRGCAVVDVGCSDESVAPKPIAVQTRVSNESASLLRTRGDGKLNHLNRVE